MNTFKSKSLEETADIARKWLVSISNGRENVFGLSGHLGAGKTAFVKCVAKELGLNDSVTSPTFVLMKIYEVNNFRWKRLIHIDAYRLEDREGLDALDYESFVEDDGNLVLLEWPENVGLDSELPTISFVVEKENERKISF